MHKVDHQIIAHQTKLYEMETRILDGRRKADQPEEAQKRSAEVGETL